MSLYPQVYMSLYPQDMYYDLRYIEFVRPGYAESYMYPGLKSLVLLLSLGNSSIGSSCLKTAGQIAHSLIVFEDCWANCTLLNCVSAYSWYDRDVFLSE